MATEKGVGQSTFPAEKNPEEVSSEALEPPMESESKSEKLEKEHPVASLSGKMDTTDCAEETVDEERNVEALSGSDFQNFETDKQPSSSLSLDIKKSEATTGKLDNHDCTDDDASKNLSGCERESEKAKNEQVVVKGEKTETGVENESCVQSQSGKSGDESEEDSEGDDEDDDSDDCQIVDSVSPSSKEFKLKQTRVHDWVQSPSQTSYKDKPSFKYNLPHWVDHFDSYFTFIKQGTTDSGKNAKPFYVFQCKLCVGVARKKNKICRVRQIGSFLSHLKFHPKQYDKFATENPRLVTKKKPKKLDY